MWSGHSCPLPLILNLFLLLNLPLLLILLLIPPPYFAPLARVTESCCRMNCCTAFASIGCEK
jgi:hypothetical protein